MWLFCNSNVSRSTWRQQYFGCLNGAQDFPISLQQPTSVSPTPPLFIWVPRLVKLQPRHIMSDLWIDLLSPVINWKICRRLHGFPSVKSFMAQSDFCVSLTDGRDSEDCQNHYSAGQIWSLLNKPTVCLTEWSHKSAHFDRPMQCLCTLIWLLEGASHLYSILQSAWSTALESHCIT